MTEATPGWQAASVPFLAERGLLTFLHPELDLSCMGIGLARLAPGEGYAFWHTHQRQEEVYVGISGTATLALDDAEVSVGPGDFVRVGPEVKRTLGNRGPEVAVLLVVGAMPHDGFRDPTRRSLISDGVPDRETPLPDWTPRA